MSRFTGKQITVMVVAACAAVVLAPTAVIAATSFVTIADGVTHSQARVDAGSLRVGGTLGERPLGPSTPFHKGVFFYPGSSSSSLVSGGTGATRLTVTSIVGRNNGTAPDFVELQAWSRPANNTTSCSASAQTNGWTFLGAEHLAVAANGGQQLTFPTGWVVTAGVGIPYCVVAVETIGDTSANLWFDIDGYRS
ncbi:MAG: hypothetical protein QOK42_297 [Frankiaceae bacterium]|jgi:hypothetical protein|nr:hypothetical protein [Frankiaceae bacterium]